MRVLGLECATSCQSVALVEEGRLVAEASYRAERARGGRLLPMVDEVLRKAGIAARDLDAVAVSVGPGSFTGVRVGVATAKGLALGTGAMLVGLSTLEVLAEGYHPIAPEADPDLTICAVLDAYRGEVYSAVFRRCASRSSETLDRLSADAVLPPEAVAASVEGPVHLIGNGVTRYRERLQLAFGARATVTDEGLRAVPFAIAVAHMGWRRLAAGDQSGDEVAPVYLRRAEAEVNWEQGRAKSPLAKVMRSG